MCMVCLLSMSVAAGAAERRVQRSFIQEKPSLLYATKKCRDIFSYLGRFMECIEQPELDVQMYSCAIELTTGMFTVTMIWLWLGKQ